MKKALFVLLPLLLLSSGYTSIKSNEQRPTSENDLIRERLTNEVKSIRSFIHENPQYNQDIAFFIDMKVMSGKNRFFIYDFKKKEVIDKGLVAHGSGSETEREGELTFSNTPNSYCTSLGKYRIGQKYTGVFGKAYRLSGLDKTNSNAMARSIVLHHYAEVPYEEQSGPIGNSLGCPMVNKTYFERIQKIIDGSKKSIILTIYY